MDNQGTTSNDNEITQEGTTSNNNNIKEGMNSTSNNNDMNEDHVTVFVAYNGRWEYDRKEWSFENSKSLIMVVPKHITLSEITELLYEQLLTYAKLPIYKEYQHLKLEVHYRTGSPWFPVTEIQNDHDLSVFISETSKTKLPLCVTILDDDETTSDDDEISSDDDEERGTDQVRLLVAYNGKWRWDGQKWLFENSEGLIMDVSKHVTLSQITTRLYRILDVDKSSNHLKLEVHYTAGSPWFPIIEIEDDQDLSVFISESWKTKLPLCVTRVAKVLYFERAEPERKDDKAEKRLINAIKEGDWVKAREIINTEDVTWTSKLNDDGYTALHYAVGRYRNNEVFKEILMGINSEELLDIVDKEMSNPAHHAALFGNTEALEIMLGANPKCLFEVDHNGCLVVHYALAIPAIETFLYLFKQMKNYKADYDIFFRRLRGLNLLHQVIDTGLIDVAYELINDFPSLATAVYRDKTALDCIIRKPELFYSGTQTRYSSLARFVYHYVPTEDNSFGSTDTADVKNQESPKKDKFVTKYTRGCLHDDVPTEDNNFGSTDKADVENQESPKKDKFVTMYMRRCLRDVISRICVKLWKTTLLHVPHIKQLKDDKVKHNTTIKLLRRICEEVDRTHTLSNIERLYSYSFCLAVENNTVEAIDVLTTYFPGLYYSVKGGHNVYQLTVLNRSEKVYSYILHHEPNAKTSFRMSLDDDNNNILHLAGHLAPTHKLNVPSGAALQMQRELQWFQEVQKLVGIAHTRALNKNTETPMMVFRREHRELRRDGEEWIKRTADSYTVTAALIIAIVFAAAITVPGGNDSATGKPIYETKASLTIFAISDAISLFTSTSSLLVFLSVITARYADEDFLYRLPKRLLILGLMMLYVSVTSMMIAFSAAVYIMYGQEKAWIMITIGALACLPIGTFVTLQLPLLVELISSTYFHGMFGKEKDYWKSSDYVNKMKRT